MKCIECGRDAILIKKPKLLYDGINVENVYLRNVEVEACHSCGSESPVVRKIRKAHSMIALGLAMQPAKLSGSEVRFLRKALRMSLGEWASKIGIAPETFSRWENGRSPSQQVEKLARIDFLTVFSKEVTDYDLESSLVEILAADLVEKRDFALVIDLENLDARPQYQNLHSAEFARASFAFIKALTLSPGVFAQVRLRDELTAVKSAPTGETYDACNTLAAAA